MQVHPNTCKCVYVCVLPVESAKAAQASLERKVARLQEDLDTRSKALSEVSRAAHGSCQGTPAAHVLQPFATVCGNSQAACQDWTHCRACAHALGPRTCVSLSQVSAARACLESQLASSRAEVSALNSQLAELRGSLAAARDSAVTAEITATRLQEERVRLSKVCTLCCGLLTRTLRQGLGFATPPMLSKQSHCILSLASLLWFAVCCCCCCSLLLSWKQLGVSSAAKQPWRLARCRG